MTGEVVECRLASAVLLEAIAACDMTTIRDKVSSKSLDPAQGERPRSCVRRDANLAVNKGKMSGEDEKCSGSWLKSLRDHVAGSTGHAHAKG